MQGYVQGGTVPDTLYLIVPTNIEYNDENFFIEGYDLPINNAIVDLDVAKDKLKQHIRGILSEFGVLELDVYWWGSGWDHIGLDPVVVEWLQTAYDSPDEVYDAQIKWTDFIDYCEAFNINWMAYVPKVAKLLEITMPS